MNREPGSDPTTWESSLVARNVLPLLEAVARGDDLHLAAAAFAELRRIVVVVQDPWADGVYARCLAAAPASGEKDRETRFRDALAAFATAGDDGVELARTHLQYGEWLRRQRRRSRAAAHLRAALDLFIATGHPLEERANRELGLAENRMTTSAYSLTAQELAVAQLAAAGERNSEIAARLYLSRHTVDYHLRKVFQKLGISSRRQVGAALRGTAHLRASSDR